MRHELGRSLQKGVSGFEIPGMLQDGSRTLVEKLGLSLELAANYPLGSIDSLPPEYPTPLDPTNVYVSGLSDANLMYVESPQAYADYALSVAGIRAMDIASAYGGGMDTALLMQLELSEQVKNRCAHNSEAFSRLRNAVYGSYGQRVIDEELLGSIVRARSGMATMPELLRIIKEYPEMIAVETSNAHTLLDHDETYAFVKGAKIRTMALMRDFTDAQVTLAGDDTAPTYSISQSVPGVRVAKHVLATIESQTSSTQHVLKIAHLSTPVGIFYAPSTYFRTSDYRLREGYIHEKIDDTPQRARRNDSVDVPDMPPDATALELDPQARRWYLHALARAAQNTVA